MADDIFSRVHTRSKTPVIRMVRGRGRPLSVRYPLVLTGGSILPPPVKLAELRSSASHPRIPRNRVVQTPPTERSEMRPKDANGVIRKRTLAAAVADAAPDRGAQGCPYVIRGFIRHTSYA
eukprot:356618-Chlamydomonas_euryale.AAC.1